MIHLLLKILGARSADALEIAAWSLEFHGPNRGLIWLLGLALLGLTFGLYRRSSVTLAPWQKITLTGIRGVLFLSLLALILEPVLQLGIDIIRHTGSVFYRHDPYLQHVIFFLFSQ